VITHHCYERFKTERQQAQPPELFKHEIHTRVISETQYVITVCKEENPL